MYCQKHYHRIFENCACSVDVFISNVLVVTLSCNIDNNNPPLHNRHRKLQDYDFRVAAVGVADLVELVGHILVELLRLLKEERTERPDRRQQHAVVVEGIESVEIVADDPVSALHSV